MAIKIELDPGADSNAVDVARKYWELDPKSGFVYTAKGLSESVGVSPTRLARYVAGTCSATSTLVRCITCSASYPLKDRADYKHHLLYIGREWRCDKCRKDESEKKLRALKDQQQTQKEQQEAAKARIWKDCDLAIRKPVLVSAMNLEQAVYLMTLIRGAASEDLGYVQPLNQLHEPLAPTSDLEEELVMSLYRSRLLYIHPGSHPDAFNLTVDPWKFFPAKVFWALPIGEGGEPFEILEELERVIREQDFPAGWEEGLLPLWSKIALHECLQFIDDCMSRHQLQANSGPKTISIISGLLQDFSVAQIYSFIWGASKDAAAFFAREPVARKHAANTVPEGIKRRADYAKANRWDVKPFTRNRDCPQSMVSRVLFGSFLQAADRGFSTPLNRAQEVLGFDPHDDLDESHIN